MKQEHKCEIMDSLKTTYVHVKILWEKKDSKSYNYCSI